MWLEYFIKTKTVQHTYQVPGQGSVWPAITPDSAYTLGTLYTIKSMLAEGLLSEGMDKNETQKNAYNNWSCQYDDTRGKV